MGKFRRERSTRQDIDGNKEADRDAKIASHHNLPPQHIVDFAKDRKKITRAVQDLLYEVWVAHIQRTQPKQNGNMTTLTEQDAQEVRDLSNRKQENDVSQADYDPYAVDPSCPNENLAYLDKVLNDEEIDFEHV